MLSSQADPADAEDIYSFIQQYIVYLDKFFAPTLIADIAGLAGSDQVQVEIPAGLIYKTFRTALNSSNELITARAQLDAYLAGIGFRAEYSSTTVGTGDGQRTFTQLDRIVSLTDNTITLAFEAEYEEAEFDSEILRNFKGVKLVTADSFMAVLSAGYASGVVEGTPQIYSAIGATGTSPALYFKSFDELFLDLSDTPHSGLTLDTTTFTGTARVNAGQNGSTFYVRSIAGNTFLNGSAGDDQFIISQDGLLSGIGGELFLFGGGGDDSVYVDASHEPEAVNFDIVGETWQREQITEQRLRLSNALEVGELTAEENAQIAARLINVALGYAENALNPPLRNEQGGFESKTLSGADYIDVLDAIAVQVVGSFAGGLPALTQVVTQQKAGLIAADVTALSAQLSEALDGIRDAQIQINLARRDINRYRATITTTEAQVTSAFTDFYTRLRTNEALLVVHEALAVSLGGLQAAAQEQFEADLTAFKNGSKTKTQVRIAFESAVGSRLQSEVATFETALTTAVSNLTTALGAVGTSVADLRVELAAVLTQLIQLENLVFSLSSGSEAVDVLKAQVSLQGATIPWNRLRSELQVVDDVAANLPTDAEIQAARSAQGDFASLSTNFTVSIDKRNLLQRSEDAESLRNAVVGSPAYAATIAAANNLDESNANGLLSGLKADLTALQTAIFVQRNAYALALQDLSARYEVLKVLGNVILETVGTITLDPNVARNESASSLISEIQAYADTYLPVPRGTGAFLDGEPRLVAGPTASSVIQTSHFKEFYDVTTLSGLAGSRIHISDADIEFLRIDLGSEADTVGVHHTRFQVDLNTGGGTDIVRVGDANSSLDNVQGALNIDAGGGSNVLVVDGSGDTTADQDVKITRDSVTGLAPAEIRFTATGGDFQSQSVSKDPTRSTEAPVTTTSSAVITWREGMTPATSWTAEQATT